MEIELFILWNCYILENYIVDVSVQPPLILVFQFCVTSGDSGQTGKLCPPQMTLPVI